MPERALAVDIGGTKVAVATVDREGVIRHRRQEPTRRRSAEELYGQVVGLARAVLDDAGVAPTVCGVGCGGPARQRHRLVSPLNIGVWRDFPLRDRLAGDLGIPTRVDNDAKAFASAEGWLGAAVGVGDYVAMVVSTGVGAGIVLGGRMLEGADGNAGHIGHVFVDPDGPADAAGACGLLEGSASGTAIAARTRRPAAEADLATRRRTGVLVGRAVASVVNLLDLRLAVVGGSVALGYGADFFDAAQATLDELCRVQHSRGVRIVPAGLGADAPLVGAAAVAWSDGPVALPGG